MNSGDDLVLIADDDGVVDEGAQKMSWRILVVDDDQEVHAATEFALQHVEIFGRKLALFHTGSAAEARALLEKDRDFAVILLDVVMETEDAGLKWWAISASSSACRLYGLSCVPDSRDMPRNWRCLTTTISTITAPRAS